MTTTPVPLATMTCSPGTAWDPATDRILCEGGPAGFAVFGPGVRVKAGLYRALLDVEIGPAIIPRVFVEVFVDGLAVARRDVFASGTSVSLDALVLADAPVEIRIHAIQTAFVLKAISLVRLALGSGEGATMRRQDRNQVFAGLRRAVGLSCGAEPAEGGTPAALPEDVFARVEFRALPVDKLNSDDRLIRNAGLDPVALQQLFVVNNTHTSVSDAPLPALMGGYPGITNAFQMAALREGRLTIPSPFGSGTLATDVSFPILSSEHTIASLIYEFSDPHYVVVGASTGWPGSLSFIWLVEQDLLVYDQRLEDVTAWTSSLGTIRKYLALCGAHRDLVSTYRADLKTPALLSGFIGNMGHYFWNEVSGVERVIREFGEDGPPPAYVRTGPWMALEDIFSEDRFEVAGEFDYDSEAIFRTVLLQRHFLVRPTGTSIDDALAGKIEAACMRELKARSSERWRELENLSADVFVVFVNLRAHNKSWIEQADGTVAIAAEVGRRTGQRVLLFLDGYSDCAELAGTIRDRVAGSAAVVIGTELDFLETLFWAYRCDFFVAVIGSGLVPLTWLADKPGVCHGDRRHLEQMDFWFSVRANGVKVSWPAAEDVRDSQDIFYSNYSIDPEIMLALVRQRLPDTAGPGR